MSTEERDFDPGEADAFTEQARWLIALHDKRSETIGQRSATLLGFLGVLLALLSSVGGLSRNDVTYGLSSKTLLLATPISLFASASCCLKVLSLRPVSVISPDELRRQWGLFRQRSLKERAQLQMARAYLGGDGETDPVKAASDDATARGRWFKRALRLLVMALLLLSTTTVITVVQAKGK